MPFALGLYLPIGLLVPIFLGGLVSRVIGPPDQQSTDRRRATLFSGALITGEAICGIVLAIPIVATGNSSILSLVDDPPMWPGLFVLLFLMVSLYKESTGKGYFESVKELTTFYAKCRLCREDPNPAVGTIQDA